ncbi:unnamed protein product, partial [Staurois parvus]
MSRQSAPGHVLPAQGCTDVPCIFTRIQPLCPNVTFVQVHGLKL